jgi:hypothetical protein
LNHLPTCIYIELMNKKHGLVEGAILCIYNCEVLNRNQTERRFRLFTKLYNNEKCIYNIAEANNMYNSHSSHSDSGSAHSGTSSPQLTQSALLNFNRNQQQIAADIRGTFKRDSKLQFVTLNSLSCLPIVLQVFISYMSVFDVTVLLDMCHVIYRVMSGGMPYQSPSYSYVESLKRISDHKQHQKEQRLEEFNELSAEQIELEVQETVPIPAERTKIFTQQQLHRSIISRMSATERLSYVHILQIIFNNSHTVHPSPNPWSRVNIDRHITNELLTIAKYCIFSVKHLEILAKTSSKTPLFSNTLPKDDTGVKALVHGSIYALYARILYERVPELLLYVRSILSGV